jgi:hypothetical protein
MARASVLMHPAANEALHTLIRADKGSFENWEKDRTAELDVDDMSMRGKIKTRIEGFSKVKIVKVTGLFNKTGQFAHVGLSGKGKDFDYGMPVIYIDALYYDKANTAALRHELDEMIQWKDLRSILANAYGMDRGQFGMREWIKAHIKDSDEKLSGTKYQGLNSLQISERIHKASYSLKGLYNLVNAGNKKFFEHIDYDYIRELYNRYLDEEGKDVNIAAKTGPIQGTRKTKVERLLDDGRTLIDKGRFKDANRLLARLSFFVEHAEWRDEWGHEIHIDLGGRVIEDGGYSNKYDGDGILQLRKN